MSVPSLFEATSWFSFIHSHVRLKLWKCEYYTVSRKTAVSVLESGVFYHITKSSPPDGDCQTVMELLELFFGRYKEVLSLLA